MDLPTEVWTAVIGLAGGIVLTYLAAILKFRTDLQLEYGKDLRNRRLAEYPTLWRLTGRFPRYVRPETTSVSDVEKLASKLQTWYFDGGGLVLSLISREAYFDLQETLLRLRTAPSGPENVLSLDMYEEIRTKGSNLRAAIAKDVGTRKKPMKA